MVVKIKQAGKATVTAAQLLDRFKKDLGGDIGSYGGGFIDRDRAPTGLFPLDLALAGGFPRGKVSTVFGPESSNKTNLALLAIAQNQRSRPQETNIFFDLEHSFDPAWAQLLGVDTEKLIVVEPEYAEQAVDLLESFLRAEDCGIVVLDSIAGLTASAELQASAERVQVGGIALIMSKLYRKTTAALAAQAKAGRSPTLIYINQVTTKIGVMFGNPETMPGGKKPWFQSSLIVRVFGNNVMDLKINSSVPVFKNVSFIVRKFKVPVLGVNGKFDMVTFDHDDLRIGQCDDFNLILEYLKSWGVCEALPKGKGWQIIDEVYPTQKAFRAKLYQDKEFGAEVRGSIIEKLCKSGGLIESGGQGEQDDTGEDAA